MPRDTAQLYLPQGVRQQVWRGVGGGGLGGCEQGTPPDISHIRLGVDTARQLPSYPISYEKKH